MVSNTAQKVWASVVRHAKEHHESVEATVGNYYGTVSTTAKPAPRNDSSASSARSSLSWDGIKQHAKDHHASVNTAYAVMYGGGSANPQ